MNQIKPLLTPVDPIEGESLMSLMTRAAVANGIPRLIDIFETIGLRTLCPDYVPFKHPNCAERLAALLDVPSEAIRSRMHWAIAREGLSDVVNWHGTLLPRLYIATVRRFSPVSLRGSSYGRAVWSIRALKFCPESMEYLHQHCPDCGRQLGWRTTRSMHVCEVCGRSLRRVRPGKIPWEVRKDAYQAALLIDPNATARSQALNLLPHPFSGWEPGDVFVAVVEFGQAIGFADRTDRKKFRRASQRVIFPSSLLKTWSPDTEW